jgi:hypothetical protein
MTRGSGDNMAKPNRTSFDGKQEWPHLLSCKFGADYTPPHVWAAGLLTLLLAVGSDFVSVPLCITGSFVSLHILALGLLIALLGVVLSVAFIGLLYRRRWARWALILIPGAVAIAMPISIARECMVSMRVPDGLLPLLLFPILFAGIPLNLLSRAAGRWFAASAARQTRRSLWMDEL